MINTVFTVFSTEKCSQRTVVVSHHGRWQSRPEAALPHRPLATSEDGRSAGLEHRPAKLPPVSVAASPRTLQGRHPGSSARVVVLALEARACLRPRVGAACEADLVVEEPQPAALADEDPVPLGDETSASPTRAEAIGHRRPGELPVGLVGPK